MLGGLSKAGLRICFDQCPFFRHTVIYLGLTISNNGPHPTLQRIEAVDLIFGGLLFFICIHNNNTLQKSYYKKYIIDNCVSHVLYIKIP